MDSYIDSRGAEMEGMPWSKALEIVHDLADSNVLTEKHAGWEAALEREAARQRTAVDTLWNFIDNHADAVNDLKMSDKAEDWPDEVWRATPGMQPDDLANAIRISLELAEQAALDPLDAGRDVDLADLVDRQQQAFDLVRDFLGTHGPDVGRMPTARP